MCSITPTFPLILTVSQNHMVERIWVEVNARVNYPIKTVLIDMMESGDFSLDNDCDKFCVSWFAIKVAAVGIELFVASWNEHPIPGMKLINPLKFLTIHCSLMTLDWPFSLSLHEWG